MNDLAPVLTVALPAVAGIVFGGVLLVAPRVWLDACREYGPSWLRTSPWFSGQRVRWVRVMGGLMCVISLAVLWGMFRLTLEIP